VNNEYYRVQKEAVRAGSIVPYCDINGRKSGETHVKNPEII
jgi:hypothetical protein